MATEEELKSREVAEESRQKKWEGESFMKELFLGNFRLDLVHPFPTPGRNRPEFQHFLDELQSFLEREVDPVEIDESGEYPDHVVRGLADLGVFGMKIPQDYGGLGLSHPEYVQAMELLGSYCGNLTALVSAHQAIGVPQPVKLFGTEELKKEYLPRCAKGAISAFGLTEPAVGSDPARMSTIAEPTQDGESYILNGEKLWCTNVTMAEVIVVMARNPRTDKINAFVVEMDQEGVQVDHRCHFMGLRAIGNGVVSFHDVKVPRWRRIGDEGAGLKIALVTLNTGRISLPAATAGKCKTLVESLRKWVNARVQWGVPIGKHEAVGHRVADITAKTFAMESIAQMVGDLADREGVDIRLEAAAGKEWNTCRDWEICDAALQVRGGRGYETERSLESRGEPPVALERPMRDSRINLVFEGTSEVMHLLMAREALDKHLNVAGALVDPKAKTSDALKALPRIGLFYAWWYPSRWIGWSLPPKYASFGRLAKHLRFAERASRKLARELFHGMARYQAGLERKQAFLFRAVDVAMELYALSCSVARAKRLADEGAPEARSAEELADVFARSARRRIKQWFRDMWRNDDVAKQSLTRHVMEGNHTWLEQGVMRPQWDAERLEPPSVTQILEEREKRSEQGADEGEETTRKAG